MDIEFWLAFYKKWTIEQLESEIGTCYRYQQNCLNQAATQQSNRDYQLRQLIQSQERVLIIFEIIRQKDKENGKK